MFRSQEIFCKFLITSLQLSLASRCSASYISCKRDTARICCCGAAMQQSTDISRPPGPQQQTCHVLLQQANGTDSRTPCRYIDPASHTKWAVPINISKSNDNTGQCVYIRDWRERPAVVEWTEQLSRSSFSVSETSSASSSSLVAPFRRSTIVGICAVSSTSLVTH